MIKTFEPPELTSLKTGKSFKVLQITGKMGMIMPTHRSTKEVVVIVQKGKAELKMEKETHALEAGTSFIIPAGTYHSLTLKTDFSAVAVMALDSSIEFE